MLDDPEQDYQLGPAFDEVGFVKEEVDIFLAIPVRCPLA